MARCPNCKNHTLVTVVSIFGSARDRLACQNCDYREYHRALDDLIPRGLC